MNDPKAIKCPECEGLGVVSENVYKGYGHYDVESYTCPLCDGDLTIPDRRAASANESVCEWVRLAIIDKAGYRDGWRAGCCTQSWYDHGREAMTYCPHCGGRIINEETEASHD